MFDTADYQRAATRLDVPVAHIMAMAAVESSGETMWNVGNRPVPPVRFEAHWFGKLTGYRFNESHPDLSSTEWNPDLAAKTKAGAWAQLEAARVLDRDAADQSASFGAYQTMGFNWKRLGYESVQAFVDSMATSAGQMDAFVRFVEADAALHASLRIGAWDDVERRYNGGGFNGSYAEKLRVAAAMYGAADAPPAPRVMRKGDRGADVVLLQKALGITPDGIFGKQTDAAVRLYQADCGIVVDGLVGVITRNLLGI